MSSTVGARYKSGGCVATGAAMEIRTVGFKPLKVVVSNISNNCKAEWFEQLADAYAIKTVAAGDRTLVTSAGITPLDGTNPGFSVGALADINDTTTELLRWEAWG